MRQTFLLVIAIILFLGNFSYAQMDSITHDGSVRSYLVHLPPYFSPIDTLPVVFSLHGLLMNAQSQSDLSEFDPIADRERFIVVYPNGISNSWNTFGSPYHSGVDDVGFISALIDTLKRDYHIDLNRVYSCGMSNGGFMSYRLACELSDRIAAIASVTGSMVDSMAYYCSPIRPFPILHFHGTTDPIVNYNGAGNIKSVDASLQHWLQFNNCPANPVETQLDNIVTSDSTTVNKLYWGACDSLVEVIHYRVNNGGHTWPGSTEDFVGFGGNINLDIEGSEIIWEFFSQYSLPQKTATALHVVSNKEAIAFYPNPADDMLNVSLNNTSVREIRLTDLAGKTLIRAAVEQNENLMSLSLEQLPSGMYLLVCEADGMLRVSKILKK